MKNNLIIYFSKTGNCKFIAEKLAEPWDADLREAKASMRSIGWMFLFSALGWKVRTDLRTNDLEPYDSILVIGPIWGGKLIAPLRDILTKCKKAEKLTHFAVTCESAEKDRDGKYGFNQVLAKAESFLGDYAGHTAAFSTALVADTDEPQSLDPEKKVHFTEENYRGAITERVADFVAKIAKRETTPAI